MFSITFAVNNRDFRLQLADYSRPQREHDARLIVAAVGDHVTVRSADELLVSTPLRIYP
jgi:hypothetical protein